MRRTFPIRTVVLAAIACLCLPAAASAATITFETLPDRVQWNGDATDDSLTISSPILSQVEFVYASPITVDASALGSCTGNGTTTVICDVVNPLDVSAVQINMGVGDDTVVLDPSLDTLVGSIIDVIVDGGFDDDIVTNDSSRGMIARGSLGNDTLIGGPGNDQLDGDADNDTLNGRGGDDTLTNPVGNDTLTYAGAPAGATVDLNGSATDGRGGNDTLVGNFAYVIGTAFNDAFTGSSDATTFHGGAGTDTYGTTLGDGLSFDDPSVSTGAELNLANGVISNDGFGNTEGFAANTAVIVVGTALDDVLIGSSNPDTISGGLGADAILGGEGVDVLNGGGGSDTVDYSTSDSGTDVNLTTGLTTIDGFGTNDTVTAFENVVGSAYDDEIDGNASDNLIRGGDGVDTINAAAGEDTFDLTGATEGASVILNGDVTNDGFANVESLLGDSFEHVIGTTYDDVLTGTAVANSLIGNNGDDRILGGNGVDTLVGGGGTDTVSYATGTGPANVILNGAVTDDGFGLVETLVGAAFENVIGSSNGDTLVGTAAANIIDGGPGDDSLSGLDGADTLIGRLGTDTYSGGDALDTVSFENAIANVTATIDGPITNDGFNNVETLAGTMVENISGGPLDDRLTGDSLDNTIDGVSGDDTVTGGDGMDELIGGGGIDTVSYADAPSEVGVVLDGTVTDGYGLVETLSGAGFENVTGTDQSDTFTGTDVANVIDAGLGDDILAGLDGADTLIGGDGTDTFDGGDGLDAVSFAPASGPVTVVIGGAIGDDGFGNTETLVGAFVEDVNGGAFDDTITGNAAANVITGGDGADTIDAGSGADTIDGGGGNDTIMARDSVADVLLDCAAGLGDAIRTDVSVDPPAFGCESVNADLTPPPGGGTGGGGTAPPAKTPPPVVTPPTPENPGDRVKPIIAKLTAPTMVKANLLRFGLPMTFTVNEASTVTGLLVYRRMVFPADRPAYFANTTIGSITKRAAQGAKVRLVVKLNAGGRFVFAKRVGSFKLVAQVKAVDAAKNVRIASKAFSVLAPSPKVATEM